MSPVNTAQRTTLRDVARKAAVNVSTVSLALRNSPRISEGTRSRIQEIAREMGYTHDAWLDALLSYRDTARRRTHPTTLAYVTSWPVPIESAPHHRCYWVGARRRAADLGFNLEHFSLTTPGMSDERLSSILIARGINGVVLSSFARCSIEVRFDWSQFAAVRIELQPTRPAFSTIAVDHVRAIARAVEEARRLGYRRPGLMLGHDWSALVEDHWEIGFYWAQRALAPEDRLPIFTFDARWEQATRQYRFGGWFSENKPDVLLGPYLHIERRLADLNLSVPADIAVIDPFLEMPHPFYAGVVHDFEEVGARAMEQLSTLITRNVRGVPLMMTRSYVDGTWQPGPSCPAAASRRVHATLAAPALPKEIV